MLCDSGTFCYTRDAVRRNYFRSTAAHNTIIVDGEEQNRLSHDRQFLFAASNEAAVSKIAEQYLDGECVLEASHLGYNDFGVIHHRRVRLSDGSCVIEDRISGTGQHNIEANFHLAPEWIVTSVEQNGPTVACRVEGLRPVTMHFSAPVRLQAEVVDTMISRTFGTHLAASKIRVHGEAQLPLQLSTRITWNG